MSNEEKQNNKYFIQEVQGQKMICRYGEFGDLAAYPLETVCNILNDITEKLQDSRKDYQNLREKSIAIYCALADILEQQSPENVPTRIDQLTAQYLAEYANIWKSHKLIKN